MNIEYNLQFANIYTKERRIKTWYEFAVKLIRTYVGLGFKEERFYLKKWTGSRRHMRLDDTRYNRMIEFLELVKIPYELGNDAPRGGAAGDYINVKLDGRNAFVKFIKTAKILYK